MTKQELLQCVINALSEGIKKAERSFATTRQAMIEAPGAMQSHSDTTKSQMSRLAEEIQRSINEKQFALYTLQRMVHAGLPPNVRKVQVGAVVEVLNESKEKEFYFVLPVGGGIKVTDGDKIILVVTPAAPIVAAMIGKQKDQTVKLQVGSHQRELTILNIH
jgi:transcription elongation GreA/GreB family factor